MADDNDYLGQFNERAKSLIDERAPWLKKAHDIAMQAYSHPLWVPEGYYAPADTFQDRPVSPFATQEEADAAKNYGLTGQDLEDAQKEQKIKDQISTLAKQQLSRSIPSFPTHEDLANEAARQRADLASQLSSQRNDIDQQQVSNYRAGTPFMYPTNPNALATGYGYSSENSDDADALRSNSTATFTPSTSTAAPLVSRPAGPSRDAPPVPMPPTRPTSGPAAPSSNFFSKLFSGQDYQSSGGGSQGNYAAPVIAKGSTDPTDINWGSNDSNADFFRASQALQKMDPNYVANNADDTFAQGGSVDADHPVVQRAMSLVRHFLLNG